MRIAVISDIHANLEAFESVLADIDRQAVEAVIAIGDNIGYGPNPNQVLTRIRTCSIPTLLGNHELAVLTPDLRSRFNPAARRSIEITAGRLSGTSLDLIAGLPKTRILENLRFVHGFPPASPLVYLFQVPDERLKHTFRQMAEPICFVGHTHQLELVAFDGRAIQRKRLFPGTTALAPDVRYIINVGSVGQPRDGTNHAKYAIFDAGQNTLETRSIAYDIAATAAKIIAAGLPRSHAARLW